MVVDFRDMGGKEFEKDFTRFAHCTAHRAFLLGKGVNWGEIPE